MLPITSFAAPTITHRRSVLADSILASSLAEDDLEHLEELGEIVTVPSGTALFEAGAPSDHLYVVLDGALLPETSAGAPPFWVGPGDLCGEVGFVRGTPRSTTMVAYGPSPRFFRIHHCTLGDVARPHGAATTRLLGAIARTICARMEGPRTDAASYDDASWCDQDHPAVLVMAQKLARKSTLETACAIWAALWRMPYRFGSWQWTASETLARGHGMCTTKAILQVALMRALGIDCGYVKGELQGPLVRACMPRAYAPRFERPTFKHYYAAARVDGRWIPLDGSFSYGSLSLIAETELHVKPFVSWDATVEGFANGAASLGGTDPYAIEAHPDLADVMRKNPTYDAKNADAMNVLLDRAQGYKAPMRPYVARMERALAAGNVLAARTLVMEGLASDIAALRNRTAARIAAAA